MKTDLVIHAVHPTGKNITFGLLGDPDVGRTGGTGWTIIDRPHRAAAVQWLDYGPMQMTLSLMLDGMDARGTVASPGWAHIAVKVDKPRSVEPDVTEVSSWERPTHGGQPPVLAVRGPVPHTEMSWVVKSLSWGAAIRHHTSGHRLQQTLSLTLLEYVPPKIVTTSSPAKAAQQRQSSSTTTSGSNRRYTVRSGDTLSSIAAAKLGAAKRWTEIAKLNNLRDPDHLTVGQVLQLPPS